jgi:carbamoylphosphate synthase large subunit
MHFDTSGTTLLLMSGGSLVGQNVVQALASRREYWRLIATNSVADEPSLADFDEVHLVPPTSQNPMALEQILERLILAHRPALVIPCRDDDVLFLARFAQQHPDVRQCLLCGDIDPAAAMLDKWRSWEFAAAEGLPFVPTILPEDTRSIDAFVRKQGLPLLVKPRAGFASQGVSLCFDRRQLDPIAGNQDVVVQAYLGDPEMLETYRRNLEVNGIPLFHSFEAVKHSIQAVITPEGELAGLFTTLHQMRQGLSVSVERDASEDARQLGERCARVFSGAGWRGPLNMQCQRNRDGELQIYEFNGRLTGATAARCLLGFDEIALALQAFTGISIAALKGDPAGRVVRQPVGRSVHADIRDALTRKGVWRRG